MMKKNKLIKWITLPSLLFLLFGMLTACSLVEFEDLESYPETTVETEVTEGEAYSSKEEVAEYLYIFEELPPNYLTKSKARELGWDNSKGNLWEVAEGMSIGGDYFGNYEGALPEKEGRDYYEADINYQGGYRNAERIVFSDDGLIFYTDDHYETFEQLYGEE